ncbi:MAG: hypothetical protein GXX95_00890 [Methanomassiliicoccus sp.]|nr:hypothetical protein [Methanomassiliicoccus sp.]
MTEYLKIQRLNALESRTKGRLEERKKQNLPPKMKELLDMMDREQLAMIANDRKEAQWEKRELERLYKKGEPGDLFDPHPELHQGKYTEEQREQIRVRWGLPKYIQEIRGLSLDKVLSIGASFSKAVDEFNASGQKIDSSEFEVLKVAVQMLNQHVGDYAEEYTKRYDEIAQMQDHGARNLGRSRPAPQPLKRMLADSGRPSNKRDY